MISIGATDKRVAESFFISTIFSNGIFFYIKKIFIKIFFLK